MARDRVLVHLDSAELGPRIQLGTLSREQGRGKAVLAFAYSQDWLDRKDIFEIDLSLPVYPGDQFLGRLPGLFADASPDRWGRKLLERRELLLARKAGRQPQHLDDWDFLVGVNDQTRMGALRIADPDSRQFLSQDQLGVPPHTDLRELEYLSRLAEEGEVPQEEQERWLASLVAPGSSLGGARPKASFADADGSLWLAKFPSVNDPRDIAAWEWVATRLADLAEVEVPETRLLKLASEHRTFCARRFDRQDDARRLYASAMTLTGKTDHEDASYIDIVEAIARYGAPEFIASDLAQLFRRAAFNVLSAHRDDHLRNHGFIRTLDGWRLSPAFDINPTPGLPEHTLALNEDLKSPDLDLLRESCRYYRLTLQKADAVITEVRSVIGQWMALAREAGIPRDEIDLMAPAFGGPVATSVPEPDVDDESQHGLG